MLGQGQVTLRRRGRRWIETILSSMLCALWSVFVSHLYAFLPVLRSIFFLFVVLQFHEFGGVHRSHVLFERAINSRLIVVRTVI